MSIRMNFDMPHPQSCFKLTAFLLLMNFPAPCAQAQPHRGCEEETRLVELATHVEFSALAKVVG
jgi:hypothetical protein